MEKSNKATNMSFAASDIKTVSVAGYASCSYHQKALAAAQAFFGADKVNDRTFASRDLYKAWLKTKDGLTFTGNPSKNYGANHTSSPFTWINESTFVGGCDDTMAMLEELENEQAASNTVSVAGSASTSAFITSSSFKGETRAIPSLPMESHQQSVMAARAEYPGRPLFILYVGAADAKGKSWCGDCNDIKTKLGQLPQDALILECQVTRKEWKTTPGGEHPLRSQRFAPVAGVPTLVKMGVANGSLSRPVASLVESQILDDELLQAMMEV